MVATHPSEAVLWIILHHIKCLINKIKKIQKKIHIVGAVLKPIRNIA
jgi:hypothetical protein